MPVFFSRKSRGRIVSPEWVEERRPQVHVEAGKGRTYKTKLIEVKIAAAMKRTWHTFETPFEIASYLANATIAHGIDPFRVLKKIAKKLPAEVRIRVAKDMMSLIGTTQLREKKE